MTTTAPFLPSPGATLGTKNLFGCVVGGGAEKNTP